MRLTEEVTGFDDIECEVGASVTRSGTNFVVTEPDLQANHVTRSGRPRAQPAASATLRYCSQRASDVLVVSSYTDSKGHKRPDTPAGKIPTRIPARKAKFTLCPASIESSGG